MPHDSFGTTLKNWRKQRRLSQLDLAANADISTRHLSFLETGRSRPSRDMILHLAECLDVPLRERNGLLVSAGFAPIYAQHDFEGEGLWAFARQLIRYWRPMNLFRRWRWIDTGPWWQQTGLCH